MFQGCFSKERPPDTILKIRSKSQAGKYSFTEEQAIFIVLKDWLEEEALAFQHTGLFMTKLLYTETVANQTNTEIIINTCDFQYNNY